MEDKTQQITNLKAQILDILEQQERYQNAIKSLEQAKVVLFKQLNELRTEKKDVS